MLDLPALEDQCVARCRFKPRRTRVSAVASGRAVLREALAGHLLIDVARHGHIFQTQPD